MTSREELSFCPEDLDKLKMRVRKLRISFLTDIDEAGSDPEAEQYFLLALASLDQAERFTALASLKQSQSI